MHNGKFFCGSGMTGKIPKNKAGDQLNMHNHACVFKSADILCNERALNYYSNNDI